MEWTCRPSAGAQTGHGVKDPSINTAAATATTRAVAGEPAVCQELQSHGLFPSQQPGVGGKLRHEGHTAGGTGGQDAWCKAYAPNCPRRPSWRPRPSQRVGVLMFQPRAEAPNNPRARTFRQKLWRLHLTGVLRPNCSRTAQTWSRWRTAASPMVSAIPYGQRMRVTEPGLDSHLGCGN